MSTLREAAEKALEALHAATATTMTPRKHAAIVEALRAELAKPDARPAPAEPQATPQDGEAYCGLSFAQAKANILALPLDDAHGLAISLLIQNRMLLKAPGAPTAQPQAQPAQEASMRFTVRALGLSIWDGDFEHDAILRIKGDFADEAQRIAYAQWCCDRLNTPAPAQDHPGPVIGGEDRIDQEAVAARPTYTHEEVRAMLAGISADAKAHGLEVVDYCNGKMGLRSVDSPAPTSATVSEPEWERVAWLLAEQDGADPGHLIWEGNPPEPWGEVYQKYEERARAMIALFAELRAAEPGKGE